MGVIGLHLRSLSAALAVAGVVLLLAGCVSQTPPPSVSAVVIVPTVPPEVLTPDDIALAVRVRTKYGLRADEAWIRLVAKDPSNGTLSGVPLTKVEEATVAKLVAPTEALTNMIHTYAESKPDYAGVWVDDDQGGVVVAAFTGDPEPHRAAMADILPTEARFAVVQVKYTWEELLALSRQIDRDWLLTIKARFVSSGVDTVRNQVRVKISSSNPVAAQAILARYDAVGGRMYVESDGVGAAFLPKGTLILQAVDKQGRPVPGLIVSYSGDLPGTGSGDMGTTTDASGKWQADLTATGYRFELIGDRSEAVGSAMIHVVQSEVTSIKIVVEP